MTDSHSMLGLPAYRTYERLFANLGLIPEHIVSVSSDGWGLRVRLFIIEGGLPVPDGNGAFLTEVREFDPATIEAARDY